MSREKQIEEMAKCCPYYDTGKCHPTDNETVDCDLMCNMFGFMANLENAGYRKQSEGEWVVEEHPLVHDKKISCSCCGYSERRGPAWNISWGFHSFCPNCGAKMKGGAE